MSPSLVFELPDKFAPAFSVIMALDPVLDIFVVYAKKIIKNVVFMCMCCTIRLIQSFLILTFSLLQFVYQTFFFLSNLFFCICTHNFILPRRCHLDVRVENCHLPTGISQ